MTIQPHNIMFEGIGQYSTSLTGIDAIELTRAYNCTPPPETVVEFVIDNVWILQMVQRGQDDRIKILEEQIKQLKEDKITPQPGGY